MRTDVVSPEADPAPQEAAPLETSWDTPAFDLLRAGLALKLRQADTETSVTLKSLDRPGFTDLESQRFEAGGPVVDPSRPLDLASWPVEVRARVVALVGEAPDLMTAEGLDTDPDEIRSDLPMAEAGRLLWRRQLLAMLSNEAGARRGDDIEYVHDMRVATRRARAIARLFGPFFRRKALKGPLAGLKRTARALGAVRDADVALFKLDGFAHTRPAAEQHGLREIRAAWRVGRRHAHRALLTWLDSRDYREFVTELAALCRTPGLGARTRPKRNDEPVPWIVGHVLPTAILNRFEQVRSYEPWLSSSAPVAVSTLHMLRIDCKALRYSLEPVEHLLGPPGAKAIRQLRRLQNLLGELQDAVVADARLAELGGIAEPAAVASYRAHQQAVIAGLAGAVPKAWSALIAPDNRRRIAIAIARL